MMMHPTIVLDADMSVEAALKRMAKNGIWLDPNQHGVPEWITKEAALNNVVSSESALRLKHDADRYWVVIRRQWMAGIIWYTRNASLVMAQIAAADPVSTLLQALHLIETDIVPTYQISRLGPISGSYGVILDGTMPIGVALPEGCPSPVDPATSYQLIGNNDPDHSDILSFPHGGQATSANKMYAAPTILDWSEPEPTVTAWPSLDAPPYVQAGTEFQVIVGLGAERNPGVFGGKVVISAPLKASEIELDIELIADGVEALDGWSQKLKVVVENPTLNQVVFRLKGTSPSGTDPYLLTMLEIRYLYQGTICGTAARPLIVGLANAPAAPVVTDRGMPWQSISPYMSTLNIVADPDVADLTIEIAKPDCNDTNGNFVCRIYSPHVLQTRRGPFHINLGDDAKTFAKSIVERVRQFSQDPIIEFQLESISKLIAEKLPVEVVEALHEVAKKIYPEPPAVLIVSADQYVPWELAEIEPPIIDERPKYLGAQALVGRWLREGVAMTPSAAQSTRVAKPSLQPISTMDVKNLAVMVGLYKEQFGLRKLPQAEAEAASLLKTYDAIPLDASTQSLIQLLKAKLERNRLNIGGADAVHFAGHGEFDPSRPDSSVIYLDNGNPLPSLLFRSARYGGDKQPLMFMNACMVGIGNEVLGSAGGFPNDCLKGGFGAFVGALWEVDDVIAHDVAIEFWNRALPATIGQKGESISAILRDLRAKFVSVKQNAPIPTYLAYVYYGHPRLRLQRAA